jgi:Ca2+-dependent lipid-binding protein
MIFCTKVVERICYNPSNKEEKIITDDVHGRIGVMFSTRPTEVTGLNNIFVYKMNTSGGIFQYFKNKMDDE